MNNLFYGAVSLLIGILGMIVTGNSLRFTVDASLAHLIVSGLIGHLQQLILVLAVRNESPVIVNMIECLAVVWSVVGDMFIFGKPLTLTNAVGIVLVAGSCLMISKLNLKR